ncbi:MAG: DNA translocase FtsK [Anaerolineae bacterium]|jgi:S-DNA-T family DNA segregation ATPase FtsK/SpoIIIE|nr:DNA translocase FtsK [Anaerolineae bacterium]MDH7472502.1 DNA translocase FtsK [Anaerolineae bacterium]
MAYRKSPRQGGQPSFLKGDWQFNLSLKPLQREIAGLLLLALGVVTTLALLGVTSGVLSDWWALLLRQIFGWGALVVALVLLAGGVLLLFRNLGARLGLRWEMIIGLEVMFAAGLALLHLLSFSDDPLRLAREGGGGGYIGWALSVLLRNTLGSLLAGLVLLIALGMGAVVTFNLDWGDAERAATVLLKGINALYARVSAARKTAEHTVQPSSNPPVSGPRPRPERPPRPASVAPPLVQEKRQAPVAPPPARRRDHRLPPIDLLTPDPGQAYSDADVRLRSQIIEETLASFGVPARVVEVNQGPAVTQFGVEPGFVERPGLNGEMHRRKVRVSKISALVNDLALALAAAPLRVEAPVPGRSIVGIEVPNAEVSLVSLRGVMESPAFRRIRSNLRIALGRGVSGQPVAADLAAMPHLLIAGATGSGKSVCINAITTCLVMNNSPDELRLVMIDPKMVELTRFNGLPHLYGQVETDVERVVKVLRWMVREMEDRYKKFAAVGARHLADYNGRLRDQHGEHLPNIVVIIDELADLMLMAPDEIERTICRIAQMARATGIHLVIATQRPSVDVITGLIKANFPARISFTVTSQVDSRVILDSAGAETLLGRGDMLYLAPDASKLVRLQGCFVSDAEIAAVVGYWRERVSADELDASVPWEEETFSEAEQDDLLAQAIELVQRTGSASASLLQRRMRIGYPRAARLIDQLEEMGIIGPPEAGGKPREVLVDNNFDTYAADLGDAPNAGV